MKIDLEVVKSLAKNINKYNLSELTLEGEGEKLTIKREVPQEQVVTQVVQQRVAPQVEEIVEVPSKEVVAEKPEGETLNSPMVGTFYGSPAPGAANFVVVGQEVNEGDTLCIVEAMKLMNEVKATKKCRIEAILVKDGDVLKKGQSIFVIS
ncbi:MAG: acetyl-CoA carboxylase biotin carboxyl carrier protein [Fusobacteriaceae bacterium]